MEKKITREHYIQIRNKNLFDETFFYNVYLDTNPKKVVDIHTFINMINSYCGAVSVLNLSAYTISNLLTEIVDFYDGYFNVMILKNKENKILKIY